VRATDPDGPLEIRADLVVGADGRHSTVREASGLAVRQLGAPMDVLWFSLPRQPTDPGDTVGVFDAGRIFVQINRGDHWQCGYVIAKGTLDELRGRGLPAFQHSVAALVPFAADRVGTRASWDDVKLLTVAVDRLETWYRPGILCIGDAAHTMSPVGGVGINLAVQDGVAAANILYRPLLDRAVTLADLRAVQRRRELPMRIIQRMQVLVQNRIIGPTLGSRAKPTPPWVLRLFARLPFLRRIPARLIGLGFRPEHIRTPEAAKGAPTPAP
ncbi:MAG: FAD-dependent oxidoreductase, partial [Microvirga sp.]